MLPSRQFLISYATLKTNVEYLIPLHFRDNDVHNSYAIKETCVSSSALINDSTPVWLKHEFVRDPTARHADRSIDL